MLLEMQPLQNPIKGNHVYGAVPVELFQRESAPVQTKIQKVFRQFLRLLSRHSDD